MNNRVSNYLITAFFLCLFLTEVGFYIGSNSLISLSNNFSSILIIILFIYMFKKIKTINLINFIITLLLIIGVYTIKLYTQSSIDTRDLSFLMVTSFTLILVTQLEIELTKFKFLKFLFFIMSIFLLYGSTKPESYSIYYENYLTLGYTNPNVLSSVLLTHVVFIAVLSISKKLKYKIIDLAFIFINIYLIYLTHSRTALVASILVPLFMLFNKLISRKFIQFLSYLSIVIPGIIVMSASKLDEIMSRINLFNQAGKPKNLNGRESVWSSQLQNLYSNASFTFLGADVNKNMTIPSNSHNYLLFIFYHHGLLILINYLYLMFTAIKNKCKNLTKENVMSLFCWFIIIISNSFESHLSTGLISFAISWILLLSNITREHT